MTPAPSGLFAARAVLRARAGTEGTVALVFPHGGVGDAVVFQAIVRAAVEGARGAARVVAIVSARGEQYGARNYDPPPDEVWTTTVPAFGDVPEVIHRALLADLGRAGPVETLALCEPRWEAEGEDASAQLTGGVRPGLRYVEPYALVADLALRREIFPRFVVKRWARAGVREKLAASGGRGERIVAVHCRGQGRGARKHLATDDLAALLTQLRARAGVRILLIGSGDVARQLRAPGDLLDVGDPDPTLQTLGAWLEACAVLIGGDSGPGHLAAAVGRPVVSIVSPSREPRFGPFAPQQRLARLVGMLEGPSGVRFSADEAVRVASQWL